MVEEHNGITVTRIASCGPGKKHGHRNFESGSAAGAPPGLYPGQVPYACAGKARWKRKARQLAVDKCKNQRQPEAPLLDSPNPPPVFGFNDNWIVQSDAGAQHASGQRCPGRPHRPSWRGVEADRGSSTGRLPTSSIKPARLAASARSGC